MGKTWITIGRTTIVVEHVTKVTFDGDKLTVFTPCGSGIAIDNSVYHRKLLDLPPGFGA